jgi:AraC-like DNA-binding protein
MSPSAFHRALGDVTASSPIQYLKKIRLNRARELMVDGKLRVNEAAAQVGYESSTQFSREFKRYRGSSPSYYPGVRRNRVRQRVGWQKGMQCFGALCTPEF